jgi:hypothetical protein
MLASTAALFLLFAAIAWLKPSRMLATAKVGHAVPPSARRSQSASAFLLLALCSSALAAAVAVVGKITS